MVFANKGDIDGDALPGGDYKKQIAADAGEISKVLTAELGPAKVAQFGQGVRTRERVERWDWNGHAILLAAPRAAYAQALKPRRKIGDRMRTDTQNGHMCMIIGYNAATGEIAISDSWGPQFAERWMTVEEANAISQRQFTVVNW